ncbi:MAG: long-chain fatty acid--CoA ligase [SAR202 cluster bacterium]|nr:long-chain fatty acid--CoA ligase [SAR202 cluster bacterium]
MNISEFLTLAEAVVPERDAIIFENSHINYRDLKDRIARLAGALSDLGLREGDRVATLLVNRPEMVETAFAASGLGAVFVPLNFRARAEELTFMIGDANPSILVVEERYYSLVEEILPNIEDVSIIGVGSPHAGWPSYAALLSHPAKLEADLSDINDDLAVLMFTAGTTGTPKAVMLTHESFSSYILANVEPVDPEISESNLLTVPLYHIAGLQAVIAGIYAGRTLIVQRQFEPQEWMTLIQEFRVQRAMMVPTMLKQIMEHPEFSSFNLSSLEIITYGAAPMPLEIIRRAIEEFPGCRFINAFGQTETASTITMLAPEDHEIPVGLPSNEQEMRLRRLTSIGKPLPDVEVRIVDEFGSDVAPEQIGELVARGPRLMKGYWNQAEATQATIRSGWLYTGDLGYSDPDGYIYLAGRAKDTIKRGGEMISPEEVENVLRSHVAVDDAAVIGIPDAEWGETVRAIVTIRSDHTQPDSGELIEYCRERLASFKKPGSVIFVDELPRNSLGKVLKRSLREKFSA